MSRNEPLIEIDSARLNKRIQDIAAIGSTLNGGSNRQALTDEDAEARNLFMSWCKNSACEVRVDSMGNIFARRSGSNPNADPILIGSHLDTQPLAPLHHITAGRMPEAGGERGAHADASCAIWSSAGEVRGGHRGATRKARRHF